MYWKHGTESIICKRCLQKRWRHVYHFCIPPAAFACDVCNLSFSKAIYLKVHKRIHNEEHKYPCVSNDCKEEFISKKLLLKHSVIHGHDDKSLLHSSQVELTDKTPSGKDITQTEDSIVKTELSTSELEQNKSISDDIKSSLEDEIKDEKVDKNESSPSEIPSTPGDKKRKKRNRTKEIVEDWNLQAPNLSESGSSDESDDDQPTSPKDFLLPAKTEEEAKDQMSPANAETFPADEAKEEESPDKSQPDTDKIMDIWANFKSFQESQNNIKQLNLGEDEDDIATPILHVTQSDHDYALIYKIHRKAETIYTELQKENEEREKKKSALSSESDSSSDSGSSCSCGSNCSCSSSSSSSSSSEEDSDSENEEKKKKVLLENQTHTAIEEQTIAEEIPLPKPETIIHESDLDTTESDTDEDFYDEHPQKSASDLHAEQRKIFIERSSRSPSKIIEEAQAMEETVPPQLNSSPMKEKKKVKKKKKDRKNSSRACGYVGNMITGELLLPSTEAPPAPVYPAAILQPEIDLSPPANLLQSPGAQESIIQQPQLTHYPQQPFTPFLQRISSTGSSCSDANDVKRSKRQRRPNKFYGYTSDDDGGIPSNPATPVGFAAMRPIAPPDLVWDKDDLPTPSRSIHKIKKTPGSGPPAIGAKRSLMRQDSTSATKKKKIDKKKPVIPKLKIRQPTFMVALQAAKAAAAETGSAAVTGGKKSKAIYTSSSDSESETEEQKAKIMALLPPAPITPAPPARSIPLALLPNPDMEAIAYFKRNNIRFPIRPPAGARAPREGESVYCYCRCPYDEVSEMIACDGESCAIEWFHFECVGIMLAPQGKWFCPECRPKYSNELYQT